MHRDMLFLYFSFFFLSQIPNLPRKKAGPRPCLFSRRGTGGEGTQETETAQAGPRRGQGGEAARGRGKGCRRAEVEIPGVMPRESGGAAGRQRTMRAAEQRGKGALPDTGSCRAHGAEIRAARGALM